MPTPKAVVFDIGNVLLHWDPHQLYDPEIGEEARKALFAAVDLDGMNKRVDLGAPFRETVYAEADKHPEHGDLVRMWHDRWIEMATPFLDDTLAILRAIKARGVPVFALSNFGVESYDYAVSVYPGLREFDREYISGRLRVMKPDARIYEIVEEDSGLAGPDLFFIDDRADNIAAATARGWQGYQFGTAHGLRQVLGDTGLGLD